jgi:allantoicase
MEATDLPNLASAQLGAKILFATDEWFAAAGEFRLSTSLAP